MIASSLLAMASLLGLSGATLRAGNPVAFKDYAVLVDDYDRGLPSGGSYFNSTGGDGGCLNTGDVAYTWDDGTTCRATVTEDGSAATSAGMWQSLAHISSAKAPLDFRAILGPYVRPEYQGEITSVSVVVTSALLHGPNAQLRIELHDIDDVPIASKTWANVAPGTYEWVLPESAKVKTKLVLWRLDGAGPGDSIGVDKVLLNARLPDLPTPEEAFLWSYSWLMGNYDPASGMIQDRANFPTGDFENVSATAKAAKIVYYAYKKGYTTRADAEAVITKITHTLTSTLPRGPAGHNTLWPHFTRHGGTEIAPGTEWASGDTVYAALDIITALQMLGDPQDQMEGLTQFVQDINWPTLPVSGYISHGYHYGSNSPTTFGVWKGFGMETLGVNWGYVSATGQVAGMRPPPSDNGSGFIENACYPIVFPGRDRWGTDWDAHRRDAAAKQIGWYEQTAHHNPYLSGAGLFGLSAAETPDATSYEAYGVGGVTCPPNDGNADVIALHYAAMIADICPAEAAHVWETLRDRPLLAAPDPAFLRAKIILSPLNNVESLRADKATGKLTVNYMKGSWNLALQAEGWAMADPAIRPLPMAAVQENAFLCRGFSLLTGPAAPDTHLASR